MVPQEHAAITARIAAIKESLADILLTAGAGTDVGAWWELQYELRRLVNCVEATRTKPASRLSDQPPPRRF